MYVEVKYMTKIVQRIGSKMKCFSWGSYVFCKVVKY